MCKMLLDHDLTFTNFTHQRGQHRAAESAWFLFSLSKSSPRSASSWTDTRQRSSLDLARLCATQERPEYGPQSISSRISIWVSLLAG